MFKKLCMVSLAAAAAVVMVARPAAAQTACHGLCFDYCNWPSNAIITDGYPYNSPFYPTWQCVSGGCGGCDITARLVPSVLEALARANDGDLSEFIAANPEVVFNADRSAVQVTDCSGRGIIASIAISPSRLHSLSGRLLAMGIVDENGRDLRDQARLAAFSGDDIAQLIAFRF